MKLQFDPAICTGCQACQMACMDQWDIRPEQGEKPLLRIVPQESDHHLSFRMISCVQCGRCADVCPADCLTRSSSGIVTAEESRCLGCRQCEAVCPVNVLSFRTGSGTVRKCELCIGRVQAGLLPACVHTCPTGALTIDLEE